MATSSADGLKLTAGIWGGFIYVSSDGGETWAEKDPAGGDRQWSNGASSADGTHLIIGAYNDYLYTSTDGGDTWTLRDPAGSPR